MIHNWKEVYQGEYYGDGIVDSPSHINNVQYFVCKNCNIGAKSFHEGPLIFHYDATRPNNEENRKLTCEEIIIKNIIK